MFLDRFVERSHANLLQASSKIPLAYLVSRGLSLDEIKKHKIGFSPTLSENPDEKEHADVKDFNRWLGTKGKFIKHRLVFPIYDELGEIKGIETRALDKKSMDVLKPAYKIKLKDLIDKLPETEVRYKKFYLHKSKYSAIFYGLPDALEEIWNTRVAFLSEGIFDNITACKIKQNTISPLTANINQYQIDWLKRYVDKIVLLFDSDEKGKKAAIKLAKDLEGQIEVHAIPIMGKDINDYFLKHGLKDFEYYLKDKLETILL